MSADLTMETNHWIVEDPAWKSYCKCTCTKEHYWTGYCGDDFFLRTSNTGRFWIMWPNIAEHFYTLQWKKRKRWDAIFASYSLTEIKRFIDTLDWTLDAKRADLSITGEVTKEHIPINKFL